MFSQLFIIVFPKDVSFIGGRKSVNIWRWEPKDFPPFTMVYTAWMPGYPDYPDTEHCLEVFSRKGWSRYPM